MRLYEIANPTDYALSKAEEAAIFQEIETRLRAHAHGDAESDLKKKRPTKKPALPSMGSV